MKVKDLLPLIRNIDYLHIEYCGELYIYDFEYDGDRIKEWSDYTVYGISDCSPSFEGALYLWLDEFTEE